MPNCNHGVENMSPVPNQGRAGLERIAKEVNDREKNRAEAERRAKIEGAKQATNY